MRNAFRPLVGAARGRLIIKVCQQTLTQSLDEHLRNPLAGVSTTTLEWLVFRLSRAYRRDQVDA
jgi:hypothetical protein